MPFELTAPATTRKDLAELTGGGQRESLEPHPGIVREQLTRAAETASERLVLSAPDLRTIPAWLEETLQDAHEREVEIVLCPARQDLMPTRAPFPFATLPAPDEDRSRGEPQQTLSVVADKEYALLHSDPAAVLDHRANPTRQRQRAAAQDEGPAAPPAQRPRAHRRAPCHRRDRPGTSRRRCR